MVISDINFHQRIENKNVGEIIRCSFARLYGSSSGSAIYISITSFSLKIKDSCFRSCVTSNRGGCIFFNSKNLQIVNCDFELCYIHNSGNDVFGNAMYVDSTKVTLNHSAYIACGPHVSLSGDTCQFLRTSSLMINLMNNTECCSNGGPASFGADGITNTAGNIAEYLNIVNGTALHYISNYPNAMKIEVKSSNFINLEITYLHFYANGLMTIRNSYIWTQSSIGAVNSDSNVKFVSCWGNIKNYVTSSFGSIDLEEKEVGLCGLITPKSKPGDSSEVNRIPMTIILTFFISLGINYKIP